MENKFNTRKFNAYTKSSNHSQNHHQRSARLSSEDLAQIRANHPEVFADNATTITNYNQNQQPTTNPLEGAGSNTAEPILTTTYDGGAWDNYTIEPTVSVDKSDTQNPDNQNNSATKSTEAQDKSPQTNSSDHQSKQPVDDEDDFLGRIKKAANKEQPKDDDTNTDDDDFLDRIRKAASNNPETTNQKRGIFNKFGAKAMSFVAGKFSNFREKTTSLGDKFKSRKKQQAEDFADQQADFIHNIEDNYTQAHEKGLISDEKYAKIFDTLEASKITPEQYTANQKNEKERTKELRKANRNVGDSAIKSAGFFARLKDKWHNAELEISSAILAKKSLREGARKIAKEEKAQAKQNMPDEELEKNSKRDRLIKRLGIGVLALSGSAVIGISAHNAYDQHKSNQPDTEDIISADQIKKNQQIAQEQGTAMYLGGDDEATPTSAKTESDKNFNQDAKTIEYDEGLFNTMSELNIPESSYQKTMQELTDNPGKYTNITPHFYTEWDGSLGFNDIGELSDEALQDIIDASKTIENSQA